jgi:hypothetical protein
MYEPISFSSGNQKGPKYVLMHPRPLGLVVLDDGLSNAYIKSKILILMSACVSRWPHGPSLNRVRVRHRAHQCRKLI